MENLKKMKECLVGIAESQVYGNVDKVNAQELGEVMDMIKDLSEAVYYCTITESMEKQAKEDKYPRYYHPMDMYEPYYEERYYPATMYASNGGRGGSQGGGSRAYSDGMIRRYDDGRVSYSMYNDGSMYKDSMPYIYRDGMMIKDPREGRSGERRKMYMDGKKFNDKTKQMQELESYMQELASDMTEMIQDASPEEKQLL